jgi:SAM-dependent methyltransferase
MKILDAGCGYGRNLSYFVREGFDVYGADRDAAAIRSLKARCAGDFRVEPVEAMSFDEAFADFVISSAVLHFARDDDHFEAMLRGSWRCLKPGGIFFCRLASSIGIEQEIKPISGRVHLLPDGSDRYLVDAELLLRLTADLGGRLLDPLKTTVVHDQRSMTTWVLEKE